MNRRYLILVFQMIAFVSHGQENDKEIIKRNKINTQKIYAAKTLVAQRQFNEDGEITYAYNSDFLGTGLVTTHKHIFKDRLEIKDISTHSSFPGDTTVMTYEYDSLKHLVSRTYYGKTTSSTRYDYDSLGRMEKEINSDSREVIQGVKAFKYNLEGRQIETSSKGEKGTFVTRTDYDSLGREVRFASYAGEKLRFERTYSYNKKNQKIDEFDTIDSRGTRFIYNSKGQIQARYRYADTFDKKNIRGTETFKYFRNGLIKTFTEDIFNGMRKMRTLVYRYE